MICEIVRNVGRQMIHTALKPPNQELSNDIKRIFVGDCEPKL